VYLRDAIPSVRGNSTITMLTWEDQQMAVDEIILTKSTVNGKG